MKPVLTYIFTFLFILTNVTVNGQTNEKNPRQSKPFHKVLQQIEKEPVYIINGDESSAQEKNFRSFAQSASPYEFLKLAMEDKNPMIRIYAFRAAAERMDELPAELVVRFKNDNTLVRTKSLGIEKEIPLSEIINGFLK